MNRFPYLLLLTVLLLSFSRLYSQNSNWISIGPEGGEVVKINAAPSNKSIVYSLVSWASIFKSEDGGSSWKLIKWFPKRISTIDVDPSNPDIVYAASDYLYVSTDGGSDWQAANWTGTGINYFTIDPVKPENLYISSYNNMTPGIWKSEDAGKSWTFIPFSKNAYTDNVGVIAVDPSSNNIVYALSGPSKIFRSTNYGTSFEFVSQVNINGYLHRLLIDPSDGKRLYASGSEGVFKSTDSGLSWYEINSGIDNAHPWTEDIMLDPASPNRVYRSVNNKWTTFISTDYGETWKSTNLSAGSLTIAADSTILSGTRDGIYASDLNGNNVHYSAKGLNGTTIRSLDVSSETDYKVFALTEDQGIAKANLYTLQMNSNSWQKTSWGKGASDFAVSPFNPQFIAGGFNFGANSIGISTDRGISWQSEAFNGYIISLAFSSFDSTVIFAGGNKGFYKSTDHGAHWMQIDLPSDIYPGFYYDVSRISIGNYDRTIFLCAKSGIDWDEKYTLLSSTDMGMTWRDHHLESGAVLVVPSQPDIILCSAFNNASKRFLRSTDCGLNWTEIKLPATEVSVYTIKSYKDIIFAGTNQGVFYSKDTGLTWTKLEQNLTVGIITDLSFANSQSSEIFAGTIAGGVYKLDISSLTSGDNTVINNAGYRLSNNYPNPFNSSTTIDYDIPELSHVLIEVYDIMGRRVEVLTDEVKPAGSYKQKIDLNSLTSGTYFLKIAFGSHYGIRKIILLK